MLATNDNNFQETQGFDINDLGGEFDVNSLIWDDEFVHARPWQAVAVVALVGFATGLLLALRSSARSTAT